MHAADWARTQPGASALPDARPWRAQAQGGEDMLLDEFEGLGLHCEPRTQLVVLCEVCRRPSTKECWTCRMKICDFCTLKRHWKARACSHGTPAAGGGAPLLSPCAAAHPLVSV